jgi:signal recognition particle GTPase
VDEMIASSPEFKKNEERKPPRISQEALVKGVTPDEVAPSHEESVRLEQQEQAQHQSKMQQKHTHQNHQRHQQHQQHQHDQNQNHSINPNNQASWLSDLWQKMMGWFAQLPKIFSSDTKQENHEAANSNHHINPNLNDGEVNTINAILVTLALQNVMIDVMITAVAVCEMSAQSKMSVMNAMKEIKRQPNMKVLPVC